MKLYRFNLQVFTLLLSFSIKLSAQTFFATGGSVPTDGSPIEFSINVSGLDDEINTSFGLESILFECHSYMDSGSQNCAQSS